MITKLFVPRGTNLATTRRRRRLAFLLVGLTFIGIATTLVLIAFEDSLVFFYSPSELLEKRIEPEQLLRLGGLVVEGSIKKDADGIITNFSVTDLVSTVHVLYRGQLPDLFREGQGVVTEGKFSENRLFVASEVLAKHDENYMPAEVAEALKEAGQWRSPETKE